MNYERINDTIEDIIIGIYRFRHGFFLTSVVLILLLVFDQIEIHPFLVILPVSIPFLIILILVGIHYVVRKL